MQETRKLNWGIVGTGKMASHFAEDLITSGSSALAAVASRSLAKAQAFAAAFDTKNVFGNYDDIMNYPEVDIIYIATPHNSHMELAIKAMEAGKHVLCEKPMGVNRQQVECMIECSRANRVFLMEAFWSRFNPAIQEVFRRIACGDIGEVVQIHADFAFFTQAPDESRLFNPELAGGALLDIGVYPAFLAYSVLGVPDRIQASAVFHQTGVDIQTAAVLDYPDALANISCGFNSTSDMIARIYGTGGSIFINAPWHGTDGFYTVINGNKQHFSYPKAGRGYIHEIEECVRCVAAGKTESQAWSHRDSLALTGICDEIRHQVGLRYPFE